MLVRYLLDYRQTLTTPRLLEQFWKEERPPNVMTIVTLYNRSGFSRTVRCLTVLTAPSLQTKFYDDSDTSVRDKYIAAAILERE